MTLKLANRDENDQKLSDTIRQEIAAFIRSTGKESSYVLSLLLNEVGYIAFFCPMDGPTFTTVININVHSGALESQSDAASGMHPYMEASVEFATMGVPQNDPGPKS